MVDDANMMLTSLRIICNYKIDTFGKRDILPEEAVHNLGKGYMVVEYGTYKYEIEKRTENENINFWYKQADCSLTRRTLSLTNYCSYQFFSIIPNC